MTTQLVYHTQESISGGISPFDKTIHQIVSGQDIAITCPYLGVEYLQNIFSSCLSWRIISDIEAWISSHKGNARQKVVDFILAHHAHIHHYKNLHAKVIITPRHALIGSANFTQKGVLERTEMDAFFEEEALVEELLRWFDALWQQTDTVDTTELSAYLSTAQQADIKEDVTNQSKLSSSAPHIRAKLWKSSPSTPKQSKHFKEAVIFSEQEMLERVLTRNKIIKKEQARKVFQLVKREFPQELRKDKEFAVRTDVPRRQLSMLIHSDSGDCPS